MTGVVAPARIQRQRTAGWRKPDGAVYVGRGRGKAGRWGNPFEVGETVGWPYNEVMGGVVRDASHAVELFRAYARITSGYAWLARRELAGRTLMCWCKPGAPCHADVLLEIANNPENDRL